MPNSPSILTIAARVYDKEGDLSEHDQAFLDAISAADRDWSEALSAANRSFGGGSDAWNATKRLATRQRDAAYERALAAFEGRDEEQFEQLQAAE